MGDSNKKVVSLEDIDFLTLNFVLKDNPILTEYCLEDRSDIIIERLHNIDQCIQVSVFQKNNWIRILTFYPDGAVTETYKPYNR